MESIELQGANVKYHKIGEGPILICIPGANGTGDIFMPLAQQLADQFTIIAVDRRGYGESELTTPLPDSVSDPHDAYRVKRDAKDIAEIAQAESDQPVYVLGSSSGAIVAMHVLKDYPEVVKRIVFHEPPINTFLPDQAYWADKNNEIVDIALNDSMPAAMEVFDKTLNIAEIDKEAMSNPSNMGEGVEAEKRLNEMLNWFKYEIRQYTTSDITIDDFNPYLERITLLNGTDSRGSFPQSVNAYISDQTGLTITDIPGGHLGYVQKPEGFAHVLADVLNKADN
ncbi:pimeloyl-ACP methyl ester carboxylesterase [Staphylococcus auricularis]|uniref:alpha/beta fold hydrolase n=1 Tax=Staphylococcus auricularis TaxID=29379 RepID=UPI001933C84A|nr:alpha/beta hydrolase [Staphylococcus auricularis]MBM0867167.1 alpha/beta hydrolase [Staphylococcus auricularis]MCG7340858.1 alpha/beta hydrolase [Staphylococcus auricularis]